MKPKKYMFVCYAARQRSPTAVDVALNLAARNGMNLEAECFGTNDLPERKYYLEKCRQNFILQDRIFIMEHCMSEYILEKLPNLNKKMTCFNIPDRYARGQLSLREILKEKINPWITKGKTYPDKKYAFVSLVDSIKAQTALALFKEKVKDSEEKCLVDYITVDWETFEEDTGKIVLDEESYDRVFIVEDKTFDDLVMPKPLSKTLIDKTSNPQKYLNVNFKYTPGDLITLYKNILRAIDKIDE